MGQGAQLKDLKGSLRLLETKISATIKDEPAEVMKEKGISNGTVEKIDTF